MGYFICIINYYVLYHKGEQMKISRFFAGLFGLLGVLIAVGTILLCLQSLDREPMLLKAPAAAASRVEEMFQAVCCDDYTAVSALMYGTPDLDSSVESGDGVSDLIWNAFVDSIGYKLDGDCYATESGLAQNVNMSYLDISSVTAGLQERCRNLLLQRIESAEEMDEIYDENNEYRQDVVDAIVSAATRAALSEDARYVETQLTIQLVYSRGQWWVLADDALMQAISGGMVS